MTKRIISVALALILALSCFAMTGYAADKLNYLVIGDSIGYGYGVRNPDKASYGAIVANTNGYGYANDAIPGHRTQDLIAMLGRENVKQDVINADIISISIGGNDYLTNNFAGLINKALKGDYSDYEVIIEQSEINFDVIIKTIKELNPDCTILMQTLYNPRTDSLHDAYQYAVDLINAMVNDYAKENPGAYEIIDVYPEFVGYEDDFIAVDGIHPSASGNVAISRLVLQKLHELGLGENTEPQIAEKGKDMMSGLMAKIYKFIMNFMMKIMLRFWKVK